MSIARSWTELRAESRLEARVDEARRAVADIRPLLAFRTAGRIAMSEALAAATPHLLEPMQKIVVVTPSASTSRVSSTVASRRGQMLGLGPREGWPGWDRVEALLPEAELTGLEAELRSLSQGLATYEAEFDHLAELSGHLAEKVVQQREAEPA